MLVLPTRPRSWFYASGLLTGAAAALVLRRLLPAKVELGLHVPDEDGVVRALPAGLAAAAGVPLAVYALASAMQSEEHDDRGRLAIGRAVWNAVREDPASVFRKLAPRGRFGTQAANGYAATARPPTARTLGLAEAIADGRVPDFVEGAVRWDAPAAQDRLHAQDPSHYRSSAEVADRRRAEGYREVLLPGVPRTRFWTVALS